MSLLHEQKPEFRHGTPEVLGEPWNIRSLEHDLGDDHPFHASEGPRELLRVVCDPHDIFVGAGQDSVCEDLWYDSRLGDGCVHFVPPGCAPSTPRAYNQRYRLTAVRQPGRSDRLSHPVPRGRGRPMSGLHGPSLSDPHDRHLAGFAPHLFFQLAHDSIRLISKRAPRRRLSRSLHSRRHQSQTSKLFSRPCLQAAGARGSRAVA